MDENQNTQPKPEENMTMPQSTPEKTEEKTATDNSKLMAVIAYFIFFLPLLTEYKDNDFVKFHVKQGIVLVIAAAISAVISSIPYIGYFISSLIGVALLVLWIIGVLNASSDKREPLPFIGKYAEQYLKF